MTYDDDDDTFFFDFVISEDISDCLENEEIFFFSTFSFADESSMYIKGEDQDLLIKH